MIAQGPRGVPAATDKAYLKTGGLLPIDGARAAQKGTRAHYTSGQLSVQYTCPPWILPDLEDLCILAAWDARVALATFEGATRVMRQVLAGKLSGLMGTLWKPFGRVTAR